MTRHVDRDLCALVADELSVARREQVLAHLASCERCQEQHHFLARARMAVAADHIEPPSYLAERLTQLGTLDRKEEQTSLVTTVVPASAYRLHSVASHGRALTVVATMATAAFLTVILVTLGTLPKVTPGTARQVLADSRQAATSLSATHLSAMPVAFTPPANMQIINMWHTPQSQTQGLVNTPSGYVVFSITPGQLPPGKTHIPNEQAGGMNPVVYSWQEGEYVVQVCSEADTSDLVAVVGGFRHEELDDSLWARVKRGIHTLMAVVTG